MKLEKVTPYTRVKLSERDLVLISKLYNRPLLHGGMWIIGCGEGHYIGRGGQHGLNTGLVPVGKPDIGVEGAKGAIVEGLCGTRGAIEIKVEKGIVKGRLLSIKRKTSWKEMSKVNGVYQTKGGKR